MPLHDTRTIFAPRTVPDLASAGMVAAAAADQIAARFVDLEFVRADADGSVRLVDVDELSGSGVDLTAFVGASSGLLDEEDLRLIGEGLAPGSLAAVLVYEHLDAVAIAAGMRRGGGRVISQNRVPVEDLEAAFDTEQASG